jgi:hypothetical protein
LSTASKAANPSLQDPYYERIPNPRKPGKFKKVKKQIPSYIPAHDADILAHARKRAYHLDLCLFNFMGIRFGWSSVIGLVPAIGDGVDALMALKLIMSMYQVSCGLSQLTILRMLINLAVDFLVGLIPFVGDLADAAIKCNSKNVRLLEKELDKAYKPKAMLAEEERLPRDRRPAPATVYEDFSDEEDERRRPSYDDRHENVREPKRAYSGRKQRVPDEEMGYPRREKPHRKGDGPRGNDTRTSRR